MIAYEISQAKAKYQCFILTNISNVFLILALVSPLQMLKNVKQISSLVYNLQEK